MYGHDCVIYTCILCVYWPSLGFTHTPYTYGDINSVSVVITMVTKSPWLRYYHGNNFTTVANLLDRCQSSYNAHRHPSLSWRRWLLLTRMCRVCVMIYITLDEIRLQGLPVYNRMTSFRLPWLPVYNRMTSFTLPWLPVYNRMTSS